MKKVHLLIASFLMIMVAILRGAGGFLLILRGNTINTGHAISASNNQALKVGIGLIIVLILFGISAFLLLRNQSKIGWILSWIATIIFIVGGLINGFILFDKPKFQGQFINIIFGILIGINLILGKKELKIFNPKQ